MSYKQVLTALSPAERLAPQALGEVVILRAPLGQVLSSDKSGKAVTISEISLFEFSRK